ncbi:type II toxin-antitoxin system HicB family antitoxin [Dyadobacter sp. CY345]|uniref:type II toxin-antitoxin system HicB family antitoxin n=1 Tax=Dyadobacter sp. CY345 TaxID=2909335 RepID=UPI001F3F76F1|nr:type II toxin-antitoxin system HicB family antitoxin [Dyadobacter sp. CY345]MCF2446098.1 type II toxin-antitoxin system HicB family antitoxin [Dyadobacter sp. CY345]
MARSNMINSLTYNGYTASISYSSEDEVFFGKIIGLNDLITFEGTSVAELKQAFQEAVEDYLETCKELNKSPEKTYKGVFNVRVPSTLHKKVATLAAQHDITLNDFVKSVLVYAVTHDNVSAELFNKNAGEDSYAMGA